ncbi:MAG: hypothetical protein JXA03_09665 [Bacteroidales bacterium]|nr:hypothetical protein [Bacteroidales bacterium]
MVANSHGPLYNNKPALKEAMELIQNGSATLCEKGLKLCMDKWGDSPSFLKKNRKDVRLHPG